MISKLTNDELEILRSIPIHSILGLSNDGRKVKMKCPFHNEDTASFFIFPENTYYCFGCARGGYGSISFLVDLGYSFEESIQELEHYL